MKRTEQLITAVRKVTGNTRYESTSGIPQDVFVQHFNDAQDALSKQVVNLKTKFLKKTEIVEVVANQAIYPYPTDCYIRSIDTIQWSDNTKGVYYRPLNKITDREKVGNYTGYPFGYILQHEGVELTPPITLGILYFTYEKTLPKIQKRSGLISTLTVVGSQLTALSVTVDSMYDQTEINDDYFLCVVDKYGNVKAKDIEYKSVSAGVFTLDPWTIPSGEAIAVGDYILVGKNTCNIPDWPDICESYLRKYVTYQIKYGDASKWSKEARDDMAAEFTTLSTSFALLSDDITDIPITNCDSIGW